jgi:hypothetical protein
MAPIFLTFNHVTIQSLMLWSKKWLRGNFLKKLLRTLAKVLLK